MLRTMRLPLVVTVGLVPSLLSPATAQSPIGATLVAVTPITAAWLNAPPGAPGTVTTQPAGPLVQANVSAPVGGNWAAFQCDLVTGTDTVVLTASSVVFAPPGVQVRTDADLLLTLTAPANTVGTIDLGLAHLGDTPLPNGFRIDLDDDQSDELDSSSAYCCGTLQRRVWSHSFANGPWLVRIRDANPMPGSPQAYDLRLEFRLQVPGVTDLLGSCGSAFATPPTTVVYGTNGALVALPTSLGGFSVLRAVGLGHVGLFLFAEPPAVVPLPLPPYGTCDLLALPMITDPGIVTSGTATPSEWEIKLPPLPPGLTFHAQHAFLDLLGAMQFGASNVLRVDT